MVRDGITSRDPCAGPRAPSWCEAEEAMEPLDWLRPEVDRLFKERPAAGPLFPWSRTSGR